MARRSIRRRQPISNPANLVIFGAHMPALPQRLAQFALPSLLAIATTFAVHRYLQRDAMAETIDDDIALPVLSRAGATTGYGILCVAITLLITSFRGMPLSKAQKDAHTLASAGFKEKAQLLLPKLAENPFKAPPTYEQLVGDLSGAYSRTCLSGAGERSHRQSAADVDALRLEANNQSSRIRFAP